MSVSQSNSYYMNLSTPESIERSAKRLEGMTFQDVLDLGVTPEGVEREYGSRRYKGGLGNLIEERFFGYRANSDQEADFPEAGVELKTTCYDVKKDGDLSAGERLVLTMISYDESVPDSFFDSHAWEKSEKILLVYYERDKSIDTYDQRIGYVTLFTPPTEDLKVISDDYDKIASTIRAGRAEDLSESMTSYLGACTKGATAEKSMRTQFYPPHTKARSRAFCFKRGYMDHVLHHYIMGQTSSDENIIKNPADLKNQTFEEYVLGRIRAYRGKSDREICEMLELEYTGGKRQWSSIVYALLGVRTKRAEEFEKANVSVRTVRVEKDGGIKESLSLDTFKFTELVEEEWEDAPLHDYFEETRFLFVTFEKRDSGIYLADALFWSMPVSDIEGPLRECWQQTKDVVAAGVELTLTTERNGKVCITNNLPGMRDNPIAHVRPHTSHAAYLLDDGTAIGNPEKDAYPLPDGRMMTKQSFWLNNDYIYSIVKLGEE